MTFLLGFISGMVFAVGLGTWLNIRAVRRARNAAPPTGSGSGGGSSGEGQEQQQQSAKVG